MFFVLECFLVTLFSALFLAGLFTDAPVLHYGIVCFSASLWLKMSGKYVFRFSIVFCMMFILWSFAIDADLVFFVPVLIISGFPFITSVRSKDKSLPSAIRYGNRKVGIGEVSAAVLLISTEFLRFYPVFFVFTVLILFYSAVKTSYKDTEELVMSMKDVLTENRIEDETQKRLLRSNARKNSEVAVLAERNRISRSLHNSIGHTLSAAILQVNALHYMSIQDEVKESLTVLQTSLEKGMTEIRECLHNIYNDSFDLPSALEMLVAETAGLDISLTCKTEQVPYVLKHDIVSMVKECISNTIKHSGASRMGITVIEQPAFYSVSVWDDGCGCHSPASSQGIGLTVLRETAEKNHGTVNFYSDRGFRVHIVFPKEIHTDECHYY